MTNPQSKNTAREMENRIVALAQHLWQEDGCPEGRDLEYRDKARELLAISENQHLATKANPRRYDVRRDPTTGEPVEPLVAVENQGEFPGLTDQGEDQPYPQPRRDH